MDTVTSEVSTRVLRSQLSDLLGRTMDADERIGITRSGEARRRAGERGRSGST